MISGGITSKGTIRYRLEHSIAVGMASPIGAQHRRVPTGVRYRLEHSITVPLLSVVAKRGRCCFRYGYHLIEAIFDGLHLPQQDVSMGAYLSVKPNLIPDLLEQLTGNHVLLNLIRALEDTGNPCITVHPLER